MTPERFKHLMNLSDLNDVERGELKTFIDQQAAEIERLRRALRRQAESHKSIAIVLEDPTENGRIACRKQAFEFASEGYRAIGEIK